MHYKRRLQTTILLFALVLTFLPPSSSEVQAQQTSPALASVTFQGNAAHTGNIQDPAIKPPLQQLWAIDLGGMVSYPVVVGDKVFVTVANNMSRGPYGSRLYALDARNGSVAWGPVELGGTYWWSAIAYDRGKIFALNGDGLLRSYDPQNGTPLWSTKLPNQDRFSGAPTALNGILYATGHGSGGTSYAVDETNGQVLWTVPIGGFHEAPAVTDTAVYVAQECSQVHALAPRTGQTIWKQTTDCEGSFGAAAVYYNNKVYLRSISPPNLLVLDAKTGKKINIYSSQRTPVFDGSRGFIFSNGTLQAFDEATGRVLWSFAGDGDLTSNPLVVNGVLYMGSKAGKLYGLNPSTGSQVFSIALPAPVTAPDDWNGKRSEGMGAGNGRLFVPASTWLVALVSKPPSAAPNRCELFQATGKTLCGKFLEYWTSHGGLAQQGLPISIEMQEKSDTDGAVYTVQYSERAVFEYHPANKPPNDVLLSLLGVFRYKQKYAGSAPGQVPNTMPGRITFKETGKSVGGKFLEYWKFHGGLAQQGLPISEEFLEKSDLDGNNYLVQYFERAVFEYHPENPPPNDVLLSQLGTFRYSSKYQGSGSSPIQPAKTPVP